MDFQGMLQTTASALYALNVRMRLISENLGNTHTTAEEPGGDPYQRKVVSFKEEFDAATGAALVGIHSIDVDPTPFPIKYSPGHPAADENGFVKEANVNNIFEMFDAQETTRAIEANLTVIESVNQMREKAISLLEV